MKICGLSEETSELWDQFQTMKQRVIRDLDMLEIVKFKHQLIFL